MMQERLILAAGRVPRRTKPFDTYICTWSTTNGWRKKRVWSVFSRGAWEKHKSEASKTDGGIGRCQLSYRGHLILLV